MFADRVLGLIAPHYCVSCNSVGRIICPACEAGLVTKAQSCYSCNRLTPDGRTCEHCRRHSALAGVVVAHHYEGAIKQLVQALKYEHKIEVAAIFGNHLAPLLGAMSFDVVTAVPGAPSRYRRRGYHQAELIAKTLAKRLTIPHRPLLLRLESQSQVGAGRVERFEHVRGTFEVRRGASGRILIVDDVLTTGATLSEAARVLKAAGAKSVWGAVVAKH